MAIILLYAAAINAAAFYMMGSDKGKARRGEYRISERSLWIAAWLGGAPGAYAGMKKFRHKTKHFTFKWGMPALAAAEAALLVWVLAQ